MLQKTASIGIVTAPGNYPGLYAQKLLDVVSEQGGNMADFLKRSRLLRRLHDLSPLTETELTTDEYYELVTEVLDHFDIPGLGLLVGSRFRATDFGILGYAMLSARNLRFALQLVERFQPLWGGSGILHNRLSIDGRTAMWGEFSSLPPGPRRQFELEEATAQFLIARELVADSGRFRMSRVTYSFPDPGYRSLYEETFGCRVEFDHDHTQLCFPVSMLDLPFGSANPLAQQICEEQCSKLLHSLDQRGGLTETVRNIILKSPGRYPTLSDVAEELNLSLRTVRRHLKNEGTTFKDILTEVRMKMARQYLLESPLSIKEISYILCYSEVANFQRAFKNWFNTTPNAMRLAHADPGKNRY